MRASPHATTGHESRTSARRRALDAAGHQCRWPATTRALAPPRPRPFHFVGKPCPFPLPLWLPRKPEPKPCSSPRTAPPLPLPPPLPCPRGAIPSAPPRPKSTRPRAPPPPTGARRPDLHRPKPSERCHRHVRPPAAPAYHGRRATGRLRAHRDHLRVPVEPLVLIPLFPLPAGERPRRISAPKVRPSPVKSSGDLFASPQNFPRGIYARVGFVFVFLFVSKNSELVK